MNTRHLLAVVTLVAGTATGGLAQAAGITLYDDADCKGVYIKLQASTPDLAPLKFDNKASSVHVDDGKWSLFLDPNYHGDRFPAEAAASLPVGSCVNLTGKYDNQVSSVRKD